MTDMDLPTNTAVLSPRRSSVEEQRRAALTVARFSTDLDDARELLDMLGLLDEMPAASP